MVSAEGVKSCGLCTSVDIKVCGFLEQNNESGPTSIKHMALKMNHPQLFSIDHNPFQQLQQLQRPRLFRHQATKPLVRDVRRTGLLDRYHYGVMSTMNPVKPVSTD